MTRVQSGFGPEPDLVPPPLRLTAPGVARHVTGSPAAGRPERRRRASRATSLHARPPRTDRRPSPVNRRRHRGDLHAVVASILAILALVGTVVAILMLATQPTAARLEREIGSLNSRLGAARSQLVALNDVARHARSQSGRLKHAVSGLQGRLAGLARTVHGLQGSMSLGQEQEDGLRACVPQLQQEVAGLTVKTSSVKGRVTRVGLSDPPLLSPTCQALLSGL
jgi:hypothetical protein